ncbi:MAG: NhaC family Na+:H+ antiporter, partial [Flavobacteriales bacterium]
MSKTTQPSILQALVPILFLVLLLGINVVYFGEDSSYGPNQVALLLAAGVATIVGLSNKVSWDTIFDGIVDSLTSAMGAIIILLLIGALAGTWLMSGIVPAMIYYGLQFLNPTIFLFAACIVCAIVSLATGSSWSTVATVGIALMGIGMALGISEGWVAGAVISGAYFGDKMSPLSDTTNLAPAVAGSDLFTHIRHMFWTTGPSIVIALIIFLLAGFFFSGNTDDQQVELLLTAITEKFNVSPLLFLVPALVIILI